MMGKWRGGNFVYRDPKLNQDANFVWLSETLNKVRDKINATQSIILSILISNTVNKPTSNIYFEKNAWNSLE